MVTGGSAGAAGSAAPSGRGTASETTLVARPLRAGRSAGCAVTVPAVVRASTTIEKGTKRIGLRWWESVRHRRSVDADPAFHCRDQLRRIVTGDVLDCRRDLANDTWIWSNAMASQVSCLSPNKRLYRQSWIQWQGTELSALPQNRGVSQQPFADDRLAWLSS